MATRLVLTALLVCSCQIGVFYGTDITSTSSDDFLPDWMKEPHVEENHQPFSPSADDFLPGLIEQTQVDGKLDGLIPNPDWLDMSELTDRKENGESNKQTQTVIEDLKIEEQVQHNTEEEISNTFTSADSEMVNETHADCTFDDKDLVESNRSPHSKGRWFRWKSGKIPYYFNGSVTTGDKQLFRKIMDEIESHSCFEYVLHEKEPKEHHLVIVVGETSCRKGFSAYVQPLSYTKVLLRSFFQLTDSKYCNWKGGVAHELMHGLGIGHTHKRADRDEFIMLYKGNIKNWSQYEICHACALYKQVPYDCSSIMHYGQGTFSNGKGPTMKAKDSSKCKLSWGGPAFSGERKTAQSDWDLVKIIGEQVCSESKDAPFISFQKDEKALRRSNKISTVSTIDKEFFISVDFKITSLESGVRSLIHFTTLNSNSDGSGGRIPGVWILNKKIWVENFMSGSNKFKYVSSLVPANRWINIKLSQLLENGIYMFKVQVDGRTMWSEKNEKPQKFNDVMVYASNPWHYAVKGLIKNFFLQKGHSDAIMHFQKEEKVLSKDNQVGIVSKIGKGFHISLDFKVSSFGNSWQNIIHFTTLNTNSGASGGRVPGIWINSQKRIVVEFFMNGKYVSRAIGSTVPMNRWINIKVSQHMEDKKYIYTVFVDSKNMWMEENKKAQEYTNVKVYASNPWHAAMKGSLQNFYFQRNFYLKEVLYFQKKDEKIIMDTLLTTIPKIGKIFQIGIDFKVTSLGSSWQSIVHFTTLNKNSGESGGRVPAIWVNNEKKLWIEFFMNGKWRYRSVGNTLNTNKWINVKISQSYDEGKYIFTVHVDEKNMWTEENKQPLEFRNVMVYASNPWHNAMTGFIKNFYVQQNEDIRKLTTQDQTSTTTTTTTITSTTTTTTTTTANPERSSCPPIVTCSRSTPCPSTPTCPSTAKPKQCPTLSPTTCPSIPTCPAISKPTECPTSSTKCPPCPEKTTVATTSTTTSFMAESCTDAGCKNAFNGLGMCVDTASADWLNVSKTIDFSAGTKAGKCSKDCNCNCFKHIGCYSNKCDENQGICLIPEQAENKGFFIPNEYKKAFACDKSLDCFCYIKDYDEVTKSAESVTESRKEPLCKSNKKCTKKKGKCYGKEDDIPEGAKRKGWCNKKTGCKCYKV